MTLLQVTVTTDGLLKAGRWLLKGLGFACWAFFDLLLTLVCLSIALAVIAYIVGGNCESIKLGQWFEAKTCIR